MAQTAVEWLVSKTELNYYSDNDTLLAIAKAKEMEREQKAEEYKRGWEEATSIGIKEADKLWHRQHLKHFGNR